MAEAIIDAMYKKIKRNVPIPRTERKSIEEKKKKRTSKSSGIILSSLTHM